MLRIERFMILYTVAFIAVAVLLIAYKGVIVDLASFAEMTYIPLFFAVLGIFYRFVRHDDRISALAFVIAIFGTFTFALATYSQLVLPFPAGAIDAALVKFDAMLGFSWPAAMEAAAQYPMFSKFLGHIYDLAHPLMLATFLILSVFRGQEALHQFTLALMFTVTACILIWSFLPGAGASAYWQLAPEIEAIIDPRVGTKYGQELLGLYETGFPVLDGLSMKGIVGFPSFHTVMFVLPLAYLGSLSYVRWVATFFAVFGMPSVIIHGGHNLADMLAGLAITVAGVYAAKYMHALLSLTTDSQVAVAQE